MKRIQRLQARFIASADAARSNPCFGLPSWADAQTIATLGARPIICCGSRFWAHEFMRNARDLDVIAIVDDYHAGKQVLGLPCIDTTSLLKLAAKRPDAICINTGNSDAGYSHFERLALERGLHMLDHLQAVRAFGFTPDIRVSDWRVPIVARIDEFLAVAERLVDPLSVETFYSVLLYHLELDREHLLAINRPGESAYFRSGLFSLREHEAYVDCGAFDGDSVQHFIRAAKGSFKSINAFEPDPQNFARLSGWLAGEQRYASRITLHQAAVGCTNGSIQLTSTGDAGACVPLLPGSQGNCTVPLVKIDTAVGDPISLLKLDVEGHELEILRGARQHLVDDIPRLALCAYHLPGDLIDLPAFIQDLDAGYRIGIRHHSGTRYDTVLYAF